MTTLAFSVHRPWGPRLIRAEILKLATRRGLMAAASCLTVGATIATFAILVVLHLTDPAHHKLIGGLSHFDDGIYSLTQLATIAAVLIGATAGAGDLAAGFFRNLVVTGRPRWQLYAARIPGGLSLLLPVTGLAYAILAALSQVVPGDQGTPSTLLMIKAGVWFELYITMMFLLALGLASLLGSRATTLGILAGLQLLIAPSSRACTTPASAPKPSSASRSGNSHPKSSSAAPRPATWPCPCPPSSASLSSGCCSRSASAPGTRAHATRRPPDGRRKPVRDAGSLGGGMSGLEGSDADYLCDAHVVLRAGRPEDITVLQTHLQRHRHALARRRAPVVADPARPCPFPVRR